MGNVVNYGAMRIGVKAVPIRGFINWINYVFKKSRRVKNRRIEGDGI